MRLRIGLAVVLVTSLVLNYQLTKELITLRSTIASTKAKLLNVEQRIVRVVRTIPGVSPEARASIEREVTNGLVEIQQVLDTAPDLPRPLGLGLQGGHIGRRLVAGIDYAPYSIQRYGLLVGVVGSPREWGPTAGLGWRPTQRMQLTMVAGVMYNVPNKQVNPYIGVRLPL
jgi:hypothetical protein